MPTKPVPRITAWSYSRWSTWNECPAKAKYKFLDRLKEPQGKAAERGSSVDALASAYVSAAAEARAIDELKSAAKGKVPEPLQYFKKEFAALRKAKALTQMSVAFTSKWDPCSPTDWDKAWCRMNMDIVVPPKMKDHTIHVIDNKTGKIRDKYTPQLELYAVGAFLKFPQAEVARTNLYFLDHGVIIGADATKPYKPTGIYARKELPKLIKLWEGRVQPMLEATAFPPRPGDYCRYCHFRKSNNGPCKF